MRIELDPTRGKIFYLSLISQIIKKNEIRLKRREIKYKITLYDFRIELFMKCCMILKK